MCHLSSRRFLIFFLSALIVVLAFGERGNSQSRLNRRSGTPAAPVQLKATKDDLTLTVPLAQSIERPIYANVRLVLVSPEDIVRAQLSQDVQLVRHQKQLMLRLAKPFERVPAQEMEMLHWLRVKYEVTSNGEILASGIEALRAATTDPFVLTAAASRVASPGLPYRVQVHVKSNIGQPLAGVQVNGDLVWDEDESGDKNKKIIATGVTNTSGNATLEFPIPREVQAEEGDLTVSVKSGVTKSGAMSTPRLRQDFPETMLWEPTLITDRRGHARLDFKLADNITTWKLTAVGSTRSGELGRAEKDLRAFQPFFVEHDPPRILTQGDEISYPLVLRNYLNKLNY